MTRARTAPQPPGLYTPHDTTFVYDSFGKRIAHRSRVWNETLDFNYSAGSGATFQFVNNRLPNTTYDAEGNTMTDSDGQTSTFDASNRMTKTNAQTFELESSFDGDGREIKRRTGRRAGNSPFGEWRLGHVLSDSLNNTRRERKAQPTSTRAGRN